jgi:DNA-binding NtrC family response regulator
MNTIHLLLIENTLSIKPQLEHSLRTIENESFKIEEAKPRNAEKVFRSAKKSIDVILFGEKIPAATILRLTKKFRRKNSGLNVIIFTRQSEAHISTKFQRAGVDDILNVMEINTPVFGWTFISTLQHTGMKKKAEEFETIRERLAQVNRQLEDITGEMTKPIGNLRTATKAINGKRPAISKILEENIMLMEDHLSELHEIREQLDKESKIINKFLAVKSRA